MHIYDPVSGGKALVVLEGPQCFVWSLTVYEDPATGDEVAFTGFHTIDGKFVSSSGFTPARKRRRQNIPQR